MTEIFPSIKLTSSFDIASPNPVPPNFLVMEVSAWENAINSFEACSSVIPIPVSRIEN